MLRQKHLLIEKLQKQRDKLDGLISKVGEAQKLDAISGLYDSTTRDIEKTLLAIRKSFFQNKNLRRM